MKSAPLNNLDNQVMMSRNFDCFIILLLFTEFFIPALANGFSLEFEWQQVFSSLQDSSQYSGLF